MNLPMIFAFNGVTNSHYSDAIAIILCRNVSNRLVVSTAAIGALIGIGRDYAAALWTFLTLPHD